VVIERNHIIVWAFLFLKTPNHTNLFKKGVFMTVKNIRDDLRDIRYFYSRKELFDKSAISVGTNIIFEKVEKYNKAICSAPPRLYDIYVSIYLHNNTQESLSNKLGYTIEYMSMLNTQLINFFKKNLDEKEVK
jgi:hypothetical protein